MVLVSHNQFFVVETCSKSKSPFDSYQTRTDQTFTLSLVTCLLIYSKKKKQVGHPRLTVRIFKARPVLTAVTVSFFFFFQKA